MGAMDRRYRTGSPLTDLKLVLVIFEIFNTVIVDGVITISNIKLVDKFHFDQFIYPSCRSVFAEGKIILSPQIMINWSLWQSNRILVQKLKHPQPSFLHLIHHQENELTKTYLHRNRQNANLIRKILRKIWTSTVYWEIFITSRSYVCANDCPGKARVTMDGNGPKRPGGRPPMKAPNDRARKYEAGAQRTAGISDEQLPDDEQHKDQLQGIVGRHPISPRVREENE